jgi:hypothetical protein
MDDLRENKDSVPFKNIITKNKHVTFFSFGDESINMNVKKWVLIISICAAIGLLLYYPYEIGEIIGNWVYNFVTGLTKNFK